MFNIAYFDYINLYLSCSLFGTNRADAIAKTTFTYTIIRIIKQKTTNFMVFTDEVAMSIGLITFIDYKNQTENTVNVWQNF